MYKMENEKDISPIRQEYYKNRIESTIEVLKKGVGNCLLFR